MTRTYRLKKRAAQQQETRQRIIEAAAALHGEAGPRDTSIKAVAERAGVERLTVYRHFPDPAALFRACTSYWLDKHPFPEATGWRSLPGLAERAAALLGELYDYYRRTRRVWGLSWRDRGDVPALEEQMRAVDRHIDELAEDLVAGDANRQLLMTARHVLRFPTWLALERDGLDDAAKIALALAWLNGASRSPS